MCGLEAEAQLVDSGNASELIRVSCMKTRSESLAIVVDSSFACPHHDRDFSFIIDSGGVRQLPAMVALSLLPIIPFVRVYDCAHMLSVHSGYRNCGRDPAIDQLLDYNGDPSIRMHMKHNKIRTGWLLDSHGRSKIAGARIFVVWPWAKTLTGKACHLTCTAEAIGCREEFGWPASKRESRR